MLTALLWRIPEAYTYERNKCLRVIFDPRNKAIMKMLNMIDIGELTGGGVADTNSVWENRG